MESFIRSSESVSGALGRSWVGQVIRDEFGKNSGPGPERHRWSSDSVLSLNKGLKQVNDMSRFVCLEAIQGVERRGETRQGGPREAYCSGPGGSYISVPGDGEERAGESWQVPESAGRNTS